MGKDAINTSLNGIREYNILSVICKFIEGSKVIKTILSFACKKDHEAILDLIKCQNLYAFHKFYDNIQTKFYTCFRIVSLSRCYLHISSKNLWLIIFLMNDYNFDLSLRYCMTPKPEI